MEPQMEPTMNPTLYPHSNKHSRRIKVHSGLRSNLLCQAAPIQTKKILESPEVKHRVSNNQMLMVQQDLL